MNVNKEFGRNAGPPNRTVTLAERLRIMRELNKKPAPQQHLVPRGVVRLTSDEQSKALLARRLEHVDRRLFVAKVGLNRNSQKAFNKHRAKTGFNRGAQATDKGNDKGHER